jgi:hypothetical protein
MAATQRPILEAALAEPVSAVAWKTKPSWFIYGARDKNIPRSAQAFMAKASQGEGDHRGSWRVPRRHDLPPRQGRGNDQARCPLRKIRPFSWSISMSKISLARLAGGLVILSTPAAGRTCHWLTKVQAGAAACIRPPMAVRTSGSRLPFVALANEPPPRLIADAPIPSQLAEGRVVIRYCVHNLRILPVFGAAALGVSPRLGHLHITVDKGRTAGSTRAGSRSSSTSSPRARTRS